MSRCGGVGADREPERFIGDAFGSEHPGDGTLCAGCNHGEAGVDGSAIGEHAGDAAVVDDRGRLGLVDELSTGFLGGVHQRRVEPTAWPHRPVVREAVGGGPVELAHLLAGDHAQALDVVGVVEWDLQLVERADRTRGEPVAAHLVATVCALLEHHDAGAGSGCPDRRRRSRGAGADHGDVDSFGAHLLNAAGRWGEKHRRAL